MTPASRRTLKWWVQVDFVTGTSKLPQLRPSSAPASPRTIKRRTGSLRACRTAASSISSRLGWASVSEVSVCMFCELLVRRSSYLLLAYDEHRTTKDRYDRLAVHTPHSHRTDRRPLDRADRPVRRLHDDHPRLHDRQRGAADDPSGPGLLAVDPRLGRQRLPDRLRRPAAAVRAPRRPDRAPARVPVRPCFVHYRVAGLRLRLEPG